MSHTDINRRLPMQRCLYEGSSVSGRWLGRGGAGAAGYGYAGDLRPGGRQTELCYQFRQHRQPHPQRVFPLGSMAEMALHTVIPLHIDAVGTVSIGKSGQLSRQKLKHSSVVRLLTKL